MEMLDNSSKSWFTKYRPYTKEAYIGDDIQETIDNRFTQDASLPHVSYIRGERGCGKTTFMRMMTKYIKCQHKVNGHPCEKCEDCVEINEKLIAGDTGAIVDGVMEIDSTITNKKDQLQEILDEALQEPMYGGRKVLIIDEIHAMSDAAQTSLLKILEDIKPHLYIFLGTTDDHKVKDTIKSRCQVILEVAKKPAEQLAERLMYIAKKENLQTSKEALILIAKKADRVPREAINLLEDVAKTYNNEVTLESIRKRLRGVDNEIFIEFVQASNTGLEDILLVVNKIKSMNIEPLKFINGLMKFTLDSLYVSHAINLDEYTQEFIGQVKTLFRDYTSSHYDLLIQLVEQLVKSSGIDNVKNEMLLITTAIRIGKIGLLAEGLTDASQQAEKENKTSLNEYQKHKEEVDAQQYDKIKKVEVTKEKLSNYIQGIKEVVADTSNIEKQVYETENKIENEPNTENNTEFMSDNELMSFFDM